MCLLSWVKCEEHCPTKYDFERWPEKGRTWFSNSLQHPHENIPLSYYSPKPLFYTLHWLPFSPTCVCCSYLRFVMSPSLHLSLQFPFHFKSFPSHTLSVIVVPNYLLSHACTKLFKSFDHSHIPLSLFQLP